MDTDGIAKTGPRINAKINREVEKGCLPPLEFILESKNAERTIRDVQESDSGNVNLERFSK